MNDEVWVLIPNSNYYYVSNYARVKSVDRTIVDSLGRKRTIKGKLHSTSTISNAGYNQVSIRIEGKVKTFDLHRLVLSSFVPKTRGLSTVNHKDGNKRNNKLENLEWCTQSENNKHALDNKLRKHGGDCSFSKLSNEQFKEIYKLATEGKIKQSKIAELYGVSEGNVSKIKLGKVASRITGKVYKPVGRGNGRI